MMWWPSIIWIWMMIAICMLLLTDIAECNPTIIPTRGMTAATPQSVVNEGKTEPKAIERAIVGVSAAGSATGSALAAHFMDPSDIRHTIVASGLICALSLAGWWIKLWL